MSVISRRHLVKSLGLTYALLCFHDVSSSAPHVADDSVERVYVIRRLLGGGDGIPINRGAIAHSGLLLKTKNGKFYVLEYMDDSKVHLTATEQVTVKEFKEDKYAHVRLVGRTEGTEKQLNWTRQLDGSVLSQNLSPKELKEKMEGLVKEYSVWKQEHCHKAQEKLRESLGIKD
jgi:hypothetical protein